MRIVEDHTLNEGKVLNIVSAEYLGQHTLRIAFDDGCIRQVNFKNFLETSQHPAIRKYLNEDLFRQFKIRSGNINWNDFDLIFPLADLYNGEV